MSRAPLVGLLPLLFVFLAPTFAAEKFRPPGDEGEAKDPEYLQRNRGSVILEWIHPTYPAELVAEGLTGYARVQFAVERDGSVGDARVVGTNHDLFGAAALEAIRKWKFQPGLRRGELKRESREVNFTFHPQRLPKAQSKLFPPYDVKVPDAHPPVEKVAPDPVYPAHLLPRWLEGEVELLCSIDEHGRISGVNILGGTHADLIGQALRTIESWEFTPAMRGAVPEQGVKGVVLTFTVTDETPSAPSDGPAPSWVNRYGIRFQDPQLGRIAEYFDAEPVAVRVVDPIYPFEALKAGERGAAHVAFTVDRDGLVRDVRVAEATAPEFGHALAAAIRAWKFKPLKRNGVVVTADFAMIWRFEEPDAMDPQSRLLPELRAGTMKSVKLDRVPEVLWLAQPVLPELADGGEADIEVTIDREGRVRHPHVKRATSPDFAWAAATAVSQWYFVTPRQNGEPVDARVVLPIRYTPQE